MGALLSFPPTKVNVWVNNYVYVLMANGANVAGMWLQQNVPEQFFHQIHLEAEKLLESTR